MAIPIFAYPVALKTVLKAAPVLVIASVFGIVKGTLLYCVLQHPHDHIEKFHFRSDKFQRVVRTRDEKLRQYYFDAINWQPNQAQSISPKRNIVIE